MLTELYANYAGLPADETERLLAMPAEAIYQDQRYLALVKSLNVSLLHNTAGAVHKAYEEGLPDLKARYGLSGTTMGGFTLCNWVLGYLNYPTRLSDLLGQHDRIPVKTMLSMLPELVDLLRDVPQGREEWERAFLIITLPLLARNNT
jgi:hypothetical protein